MPIWTNQPPDASGPYAFRILRTPPDRPITAIITTPDLIGCNTHFIKNRTTPCEGPEHCPACAAGHSWRWHGYVACVLTHGLEHVLFECTPASAETFRNYLKLYNTLRGCSFTAWRPSKRHNGRVVIQCKYTDPAKTPLPEPPDVKTILCHIWNIQNTHVSTPTRLRPPFLEASVTPGDEDGRYRPGNHH